MSVIVEAEPVETQSPLPTEEVTEESENQDDTPKD